jgi:hypothetical protein
MRNIRGLVAHSFFAVACLLCFEARLFAQQRRAAATPAVATPAASATPQASPNKKKQRKLPASGELSSSSSGGYGSHTVGDVWGGVDAAGKQTAPIGGSVSKVSPREWKASVTNNSSKDTYSVDVRVSIFNARGNKIKGDSFSFRLKPKQSASRSMTNPSGGTEATLSLEHWKKIGGSKESEAEESGSEDQEDVEDDDEAS